MLTDNKSHPKRTSELKPRQSPEIAVCETRPGKLVFLESGNTDGWIASDLTVDTIR
jgi:hypothetical protein